MSELNLTTRKQPAQFRPGEEIHGVAQWELGHPPKSVEVRLLWHTSGTGTKDVCIVDTVQIEAPLQTDTREFQFIAPEAPYSFSGRLITLQWTIELVAMPSKDDARIDVNIAPTAAGIDLRNQQPADGGDDEEPEAT